MKKPLATLALILVGVLLTLLYERMTAPTPPAAEAPARPVELRAVTPRGNLSDAEASTIALFEQAKGSVAYIFTESVSGGVLNREVSQGAGSGFVWDTRGHVVTNAHVVQGAGRIRVQLDAGQPLEARLVGIAPAYDVAVVRLVDPPRELSPLPIGQSSTLKVGQFAFAIGNPFGLSKTLTSGIVSALDRRLPTEGGREIAGVIQTDAAINPGNSGGPLLDSAGRLIGVNTAILSESGSSAGVGFAIPVDLVQRIVPELIAKGRLPRPGIGIAAADERLATAIGVPGVVIAAVAPGSPAAEAGLQPLDLQRRVLGDVIVAVGGQAVRSLPELVAAFEAAGIGTQVELTVLRGSEQRTVVARLVDVGG